MTEVYSRAQAGYRVLLIVLWLTVLILAVVAWAGWAIRSLSLLSESLHLLVDCFSTLLSLCAVSGLQHTKGQEIWGHRKQETTVVLLLVAGLGFVGLSLLGISVYQFQSLIQNASLLPVIRVDLPLILLLCVVISVHVCLVLFERYEARMLEIAALRHNANHILQDVWLAILMLLGLIGVYFGYGWLDALMAIVLIVMLVPSVWRVINWQVPSMAAQVAIAPEVLNQLALQVEGVAECQRIDSRGIVGRPIWVRMHLRLHPEAAGMAQIISGRIEGLLRERYGVVYTKIYIQRASRRFWFK